jgi:hypothetical protein
MTDPSPAPQLPDILATIVAELTERYSLSHDQAAAMARDFEAQARHQYRADGSPYGFHDTGLARWIVERRTRSPAA